MASRSDALSTRFRPPTEDYVLDNLLVDLSKAITREELVDLKQRFKHVQQLQGVDSPRKLFDCLKKGKFIGQYNILYIQQIVRVLEREDLVGILNKYVEVLGEDKVLHFIEKSKETVNGYSQIEFHIKGHGISDPTEIETFRIEVSRLLLCPLHEVIINGIQATNSTVLTIMIPTMYETFLIKQLEKHSHRIISSFVAINVDTITVNTNKFELLIEGKIYKAKKESRAHGPIQLAEQDCAPRRNGNKQQTTNAQALLKNERKRSIIETRSHAKHAKQAKQLSPPRNVLVTIILFTTDRTKLTNNKYFIKDTSL